MNALDIFILLGIVVGLITGLRKGLIREVTGLAALIIGVVGARILAPDIIPYLGKQQDPQQWKYVVSWLISFIGLSLIINLIGWLLTRTVEMAALGCINKLLGAIFGGIKYILLFSILFNLWTIADRYVTMPGQKIRQESVLYQPVKQVVAWSLDHWKRIKKKDLNQPPVQNV